MSVEPIFLYSQLTVLVANHLSWRLIISLLFFSDSKVASTESVAMWLISHRHIVNFLVSVRINDCNIDSSLMLPLLTQNGAHSSPLVDLLSSKSIKVLDLSENPLFKILYDQPRLDEWEEVESSDDPLLVAERIQSRTNSLALPTKNKVEADQLQREARLLLKERERLRIKGIKEFTQALRDNTSLSEINLSSTCMDPFAAIKVLEALSEPLMVSGLLRAVDISKNPILKAKEDYVISNEALEIQAMECGTTYSPDTPGTATTTERSSNPRGTKRHSESSGGGAGGGGGDRPSRPSPSPFTHALLDPVKQAAFEHDRASKELGFHIEKAKRILAPGAELGTDSRISAAAYANSPKLLSHKSQSLRIPRSSDPLLSEGEASDVLTRTSQMMKHPSKSLRVTDLSDASIAPHADSSKTPSPKKRVLGVIVNIVSHPETLAQKKLELHLQDAEMKLKEAARKLQQGASGELRDALHHYYIRCLEMALDRCQGINDLNISTTFLSKDQLAPLMQGLQFNHTLCKLDLSNCKVVHDEIESFSNMLMENKSIDSLVLRSTGNTFLHL